MKSAIRLHYIEKTGEVSSRYSLVVDTGEYRWAEWPSHCVILGSQLFCEKYGLWRPKMQPALHRDSSPPLAGTPGRRHGEFSLAEKYFLPPFSFTGSFILPIRHSFHCCMGTDSLLEHGLCLSGGSPVPSRPAVVDLEEPAAASGQPHCFSVAVPGSEDYRRKPVPS